MNSCETPSGECAPCPIEPLTWGLRSVTVYWSPARRRGLTRPSSSQPISTRHGAGDLGAVRASLRHASGLLPPSWDVSAADEEQLASDVLEKLDDLYDQLIGVRQLERHLRAASVALRGASWASILNAAVSALTEISTQGVGESERNTLARRGGLRAGGSRRRLRAVRAPRLAGPPGQERLRSGGGYDDHDLVFCRRDGKPFHPKRFSREFDRRLARFALPRWSVPRLNTQGKEPRAPGRPSRRLRPA